MTSSTNHGREAGPEPGARFNQVSAAEAKPLADQPRGLRVCLITTEFHGLFRNGGIGTANTGLALALVDAGFEVTVAFADADESGPRVKVGDFPALQKHYRSLGITLDYVPAYPHIPKAFDDCRSASYCVYLYLQQHGFDVVYFNDCGGQGYYSLLAKHVGTFHNAPRMYVVAHGPQEWVLDINSIFWEQSTMTIAYLERRSVELADALISPSRYMADWMKSHGWTMPAQVRVLQNIVPTPDSELPRASGLNPGSVTEIVFFGRIEVRKGVELFCDAIDLLNRSADISGIKVTFMGKFGHIGGVHSGVCVFERARRWRSSTRILGKYSQAEALSYLSRPGVLAVIPSYVENSPCVVVECLQLGLPFVATASGGTVELVAAEDRDACLFPADPRLLAEKLGSILISGHRPARLAISQADVREQWISLSRGEPQGPAAEDGPLPASGSGAVKLPLVSICLVRSSMPADAGTLIDALLRQTYPHLELVVLDDGAGTASSALAGLGSEPERIPLRVVPGSPFGRAAGRNAAAAKASGDYLLFIEEDNVIPLPECVEVLVHAAQRTGADMVTAMGLQFQRLGRRIDPQEGRLIRIPLGASVELGSLENCFGNGAFLVARQSFEQRGGFETPCAPEIEEWLYLAASVLSGQRLEVVPEVLFSRGTKTRASLGRATALGNYRRILEAYSGQSMKVFKRAIEAFARFNGQPGENLQLALDGASPEAQEIARRISTSFDPNSEDAFRGLVQFCLERHNVAGALDFALYNGRGLLYEAIGSIKQTAETVALDTVRQNALDMWHDVVLTDDVRQRILSASVFPAGELERPLGAVASHTIDAGTRILKAAGVCPPGARAVRAAARVEAFGASSAATSLALVVSSPNARLRLSKQGLESSETFWWSGWVSPSAEDSRAELLVELSEAAESLLDVHFLSKTGEGAIHPAERVVWESITATLLVNGAVTPSTFESLETGTPVSRQTLEHGILLTEHADFPFPVFVPGDSTLLHPLPGRATLVRLEDAIPPGATGVRSVVSVQRAEAHTVQFAAWIKPSSVPATNVNEFNPPDAFSGWFPVTDKFRHHIFTLKLKQPAGEPMDLYLATRVVEYPDVHFCHAVWHQLLILGEGAAGAQ